MQLFTHFIEGGLGPMSILTILLVAIFFAAWKAPRWVKEIGIFAFTFGFLSLLIGLMQMFTALNDVAFAREDVITGLFDLISPGVFFKGLKVNSIPLVYSIVIYLISLVIRMLQKPKL